MSYDIHHRNSQGLGIVEIRHKYTGALLSVLPGFGGGIHQVRLSHKSKLHTIHGGAQSLEEYKQLFSPRYSGAFMLPFPNRIRNGQYVHAGREYQLPLNDEEYQCALHGFCDDKTLDLVECNEVFGRLVLQGELQGQSGYPFPLFVRHTYRLSVDKIDVTSYVRNDHSIAVPIGVGWHPYIQLEGSIDSYELKIPANHRVVLGEQLVPTGEVTLENDFEDYQRIGNRYMNDCYKLSSGRTLLRNPNTNIEVFVEQDVGSDGYNYGMYYTPPSRNALAIEPMTCAPDAFNNGMGVKSLGSGESMELNWSMGILNT
jgi:aldose 1-epimerase